MSSVFCQEGEEVTIDEDTPIQKIINKADPRPKFFVFNYELAAISRISLEDDGGVRNSKLEKYKRLQASIKFPIAFKKNLQIIGGLSYSQGSFEIELPLESTELIDFIQNTKLKNVRGEILLKINLPNDKFLFSYMSGSIRSNKLDLSSMENQANYAFTLLQGKRISPNTDFGYGAGVAVTLGRPIVFPLIAYNHRFNARWFLSVVAPKLAKLRYTFSKQLFAHALIQGGGGSYFIDGAPEESDALIQFSQSEINISLSIEREIHDWLWFRIIAGQKIPLNYYFSELGKNKPEDRVLKINAKTVPFVVFSLFGVVPEDIINRAKGR